MTETVTTTSFPPYSIVAGIDGSDITEVVLERAFDTARRQDGATVHVVAVVPVRTSFLHKSKDRSGDIEELEKQLSPRVSEAFEPFGTRAATRLYFHVRAGDPAEEILDVIAEAEADLVVLGRHGWSAGRPGLVGSVSDRVLRLATCSALLVQPPDYEAVEVSTDVPCDACARVRAETAGDRWFCEIHTSDDSRRRIILYSTSSVPTRPGGVY